MMISTLRYEDHICEYTTSVVWSMSQNISTSHDTKVKSICRHSVFKIWKWQWNICQTVTVRAKHPSLVMLTLHIKPSYPTLFSRSWNHPQSCHVQHSVELYSIHNLSDPNAQNQWNIRWRSINNLPDGTENDEPTKNQNRLKNEWTMKKAQLIHAKTSGNW